MPNKEMEPKGTAETPDGSGILRAISEHCEKTIGHGWKRRLAEGAGVSESTVHGWLKAGQAPSWFDNMYCRIAELMNARRNGRALAKKVQDFRETWQIVETDKGFSVYRVENGVGKIVAMGIPNIETAREIAGLPRLKSLSKKISVVLGDVIANNLVDEAWISEADKRALEELETWSTPPTLDYTTNYFDKKDYHWDALDYLLEESTEENK